MRSLTDFLNDLPGVMTRKARAVVLQGDLLSNKEKADIHARNQSFLDTVVVLGPNAAASYWQQTRSEIDDLVRCA